MEHLGKMVVAVTLVASLAGGGIGFALSHYVFPTVQPTHDVEQYYRGIYDVCRSALHGEVQDCLDAVLKTKEKGWYEVESKGWVWSP